MPKQRGRGGSAADVDLGLNITSMMDMFTIILLFLLQSYSADGSMLTASDDLALPNSIAVDTPDEVRLQLTIAPGRILLDNRDLVATEDILALTDSVFVNFDTEPDEDKPVALQIMEDSLSMHMKANEQLFALNEITEQSMRQIIIQVDKSMYMSVVTNIMQICARTGFTGMKFAVMSRGED
ncbi:ExbD/TolR family protein [Chitinivibrio alkaliphilus]|uniref:Biopolymer transport protein ExbD/TolR n=1 Tax=Chitinivibrio alkaliphilus ACht1 TaxID=1313304 RepID=U7D4Z4_9BACT|nr:biopolymer transporter ExbD [Chitinivibrio alkaliphilus]ERP31589.1 Biopolymer transport protein ExbD/TolR [Chitinivibrio alkaliphilus ACht1]